MTASTSPLRYPGGKSCLYDVVTRILRLNSLGRGHYAEPYAGGAGLALKILYGGHATDIHINDFDPSIWAFWHSVLNDTDDLIRKIARTRISIPEWRRQRAIYLEFDDKNPLELGFSAFYLNRTNRSGIIKGGGVIGGLDQSGPYKMDCRFNKEELIAKIRRIRHYSDRIHLTKMDALKFLGRCERRLNGDVFYCIDPPYFENGRALYSSAYQPDDHRQVAGKILKLRNPWIVTYDDAPQIRENYDLRRQFSFDIQYSVQTKRIGTELLIASKGLKIPSEIRDRLIHRPSSQAA